MYELSLVKDNGIGIASVSRLTLIRGDWMSQFSPSAQGPKRHLPAINSKQMVAIIGALAKSHIVPQNTKQYKKIQSKL